ILHFQMALETNPGLAGVHYNLAQVLLLHGRGKEAIGHLEKAIELQPRSARAENSLAWVLATHSQPELRNGAKAIELATSANQSTGGKNITMLGTLAAAYAEAGRFSEAVKTARQALQLAEAQSNTAAAASLHSQLRLYEAGTPFRDTAGANR